MKRFTHIFVPVGLAAFVASCAGTHSSVGGEVTGVAATSWSEPTPYGMVLIDRGSMKVGPARMTPCSNIKADPRGISVESFWMDETEITNSKYKQFVFWVRDSIIRERLPIRPMAATRSSRSRKIATAIR